MSSCTEDWSSTRSTTLSPNCVGSVETRKSTARPPSVILMRGLMAGYYFGIEAFIPLMLEQHRGMSVTMAGLSLATATVGWAAASWAINRPFVTTRLSRPTVVRLGVTICAVSLLGKNANSKFSEVGSAVGSSGD